ncbi:MAG: efflux RND transporter periplasmic adaptor subunit [Planctomycetota bacterium]
MTNRRNVRIAFALAAIVLVFALPRLVDASGPAPVVETNRPLPVEVMPAEAAQRFTTRRTYTGRLDARRVAALAFERIGLLREVNVDEGARVNAGDPLAVLDTRELELDRRSAVAERDGAAAQLAEMKAGPRKQTIEAARQVVRDLEAQEEIARRKLKRRNELSANAISEEAVEEAEFFRNSVSARLVRAREILAELEEGTRKEKIEAQEALVRRLDARIANIDVALTKSVLKAPFKGTIAARRADEGAVLSPNQPLLELVEADALEARIGLPPDEAVRLPLGAEAEVLVAGKRVSAVLRARHPQIDAATRTQLHIFRLVDAPRGVVRGQVARVELDVEVESDGIWVPHSALVRAPRGLWAAYVVENGVVARREVSVVHTDGSMVFVRGTLRAGETLIRSGAHRVVVGQRVHVEN